MSPPYHLAREPGLSLIDDVLLRGREAPFRFAGGLATQALLPLMSRDRLDLSGALPEEGADGLLVSG